VEVLLSGPIASSDSPTLFLSLGGTESTASEHETALSRAPPNLTRDTV